MVPQGFDWTASSPGFKKLQLRDDKGEINRPYYFASSSSVIDYVEDWDSRRRLLDRRRNGNWWNAGVANRQNDMRANGFRYRVGAVNQSFENLIRNVRGDHKSERRRSHKDFVNRGSSNDSTKGED
ncbi:hypothetical protein TNCV_1443331 [Trichonephila clavipes]|nr:hypothetical protein TNCV_1443331 [Trichonephila clavipes]